MLKHKKTYLSIYLSILIILTLSFSFMPIISYADISSNQKVVSHEGAWTGYVFDYSLMGKYFTINDATDIPTSTYLSPKYFYTDDNVTFYALEGLDLYTAILNRGIGVAVSGSLLNTLWTSFGTSIAVTDSLGLHYQGALYDASDNFLGYCVNDISGCYYNQPAANDTPAVDVPDELTDDVYNHYKYYTKDVNSDIPDFITVTPPSKEWILSKTLDSPNTYISDSYYNDWLETNIDTLYQADNIYTFIVGKYGGNNYSKYRINGNYILNNVHYIYSGNDTNWINLCNYYDITTDNTNLLFSDMYSNPTPGSGYSLQFYAYDSNDNVVNTFDRYNISVDTTNHVINGGYTIVNNNQHATAFPLGNIGSNLSNQFQQATYCFLGKDYTIYKDQATYNNIKNKTYNPSNYPSSTYLNYNPQNDNSFTINYNNIDNSTTINDTIYNDSHDVYYDNTEDGNQDITEIANNITIIIENYYPTIPGGNPGPGGGDEPGTDNPGTGGGDEPGTDNPGTGDNDLNDNTVLQAILSAVRTFFRMIGELLGSVLAGLLEMINALLESIAGIMSNLTGITDFLSALFSWIPSPVPEILAIGFSICILAAVIKFIRG